MGKVILSRLAPHEKIDRMLSYLSTWTDCPWSENSDCNIYVRGGRLVKIIRGEDGAPSIQDYHEADLTIALSRVFDFYRTESDAKNDTMDYAQIPKSVVAGLLALGEYKGLRTLKCIVSHPVVRDDGTIFVGPGYDKHTGVFVSESPEVLIQYSPDKDQIDNARLLLEDVIADFPMRDQNARAAWFCGLLTPIMRHSFRGPCPMILVDSSTRGTGKSLSADIACMISTGRVAPRIAATDNEEEVAKQLFAVALDGDEVVLIDNISGPFGGQAVDSTLTSEIVRGRMMRTNSMRSASVLFQLWGTGNNITIRGDGCRRIAHCRMESDYENPEDRSSFRHPRIIQYVEQHRSELLSAVLTLVRGYYSAGRPNQPMRQWGSFEGWCDSVASVICWAGLGDVTRTRDDLVNTDEHTMALERFLTTVRDEFGNGEFTASSLARFSELKDVKGASMGEMLIDFCNTRGGRPATPNEIGYRLRKYKGRVCNGMRLKAEGKTHGSARWTIEFLKPVEVVIPTKNTITPHMSPGIAPRKTPETISDITKGGDGSDNITTTTNTTTIYKGCGLLESGTPENISSPPSVFLQKEYSNTNTYAGGDDQAGYPPPIDSDDKWWLQ